MCGWLQNGWKEAEFGSYVEIDEKNVNIDEPTSFLDHVYLGGTQRECKPNGASIETRMAKTSRTNISVVLRCGRTCSKMRCAILWYGKQESGAIVKSFKSLPGWPSIQAGRTRISWRLVRSFITDSFKMLVLGTNWKTWHSVVGQQACEISDKMDKSLWQTIGMILFLHSSPKWWSSILSCGKHGTALQTWSISRLRLCWRPWGFKISLRRCLVYFWKQNTRSSQLYVLETNFCLAQFYRFRNSFSESWITYGVTCSWSRDIVI